MINNPRELRLKAESVPSNKINLYWEVSAIPEKIISLYFNVNFDDLIQVIRIYDVSHIIFNGRNAHRFFEIAIPFHKGKWSVKGLAPNRSYLVEMGVKFQNGSFFPILRSNTVQTHLGCNLEVSNTFQKETDELPPKWTDHVSTYTYYLG